MAKSYRFFVTCPSGFEYQLVKELKNIIPSLPIEQKQGGAEFTGSFSNGLKICLWSRIAGKALLALEDFNPHDEKEIYERAKRIKWSDFFYKEKTIAVDTTLVSKTFTNSSYLSLLVKDGISDHFRTISGSRPNVDKQDADIRINLFVSKNSATISLDISGGSLHQRGYRRKGAVAPLKENLAAALLERAGWNEMVLQKNMEQLQQDIGKPAFVDPMCGSGTFLIEAAMIASSTAPGLLRKNFSFQHLRQFKNEEWKALVDEAYKARDLEALSPVRIFGFDIDGEAIRISKENIKSAGFSSCIDVKKTNIADIEKHLDKNLKPGLVAINLPYGKRLGSDEDLSPLYQLAGEKIKENFEGFKVIALSGDEELSRSLGMKPLQVNTVYNGSIKSVSAIFSIDSRYREKTDLSGQEASSSDRKTSSAQNGEAETPASVYFSEMLANRLRKNIKALRKWKTKESITSYRIYDADIPEYSASIDVYEDKFLYIQEYAPPAEIPEKKADRRLKEIIYTAQNITGINYKNINVRQKKRQKKGEQYKKRGEEGVYDIVQEDGLSFYVNFYDYLDTGIFLDHRIIRKMIRELSAGKKMLNLFSYTGTASVYAAAGGALSTTSVDTNSTYCSWAERNFLLNKMGLKTNKIIKADCMDFLAKDNELYDIIFIDPPTFSNSKSREDFFDIQADHSSLITLAAEKLKKDGIIIFSSNFKKFKLDDNISTLFFVSNITEQTVSPDFERHGYLRHCWILKKDK
ncbi:MAG: bifunctional 23S rRNA (guanine(2069)-N(7))-methyltransferase RlmK/23S rRNA (guanine(2445)-N(2))-methyltransferase RlmL [Spirochaetaceae bacterium]|nr:bifunctional 23S rRNA (guanine(2069)-N(7))-methyltransferase RlmK/23S rRNA (guanine(2445)-N(2))-methyltransferase RlmL [Spirochaetaceae bacterium]